MSDFTANSAGGTDSLVAPATQASKQKHAEHGESGWKLWITVIPFIFTGATFLLQMWQQHVESRAKVDSEWREAMRQVSSAKSETAIQGAYEMESFLNDKKYGSQAGAIAAALLPNIDDHIAFDLIYFDLLDGKATKYNQNEFIAIDSSITQQLKDEYYKVQDTFGPSKPAPRDNTLENFVMNPDLFYRDNSESDKIGYVLNKTWELDSVSNGLALLWSHQLTKETVDPSGQGLQDLVFLNNNFSNVDFTRATMNNVEFVGDCKVNEKLLPQTGTRISRDVKQVPRPDVRIDCATPRPLEGSTSE